MAKFSGFPAGKISLVPLPGQFFTELLPEIESLAELKLLLYFFWRLDRMEGTFRGLCYADLAADARFLHSLGGTGTEVEALVAALAAAVGRGALLQAEVRSGPRHETYYFLNSSRGRAAVQAIARGLWNPVRDRQAPAGLELETPTIFRLYEEHIGPLTPMIADALKDAEETFPAQWIQEAVRIAVENNKRNWRYVTRIMQRWQQEGRNDPRKDPQNRRDSEEALRRYAEWDSAGPEER